MDDIPAKVRQEFSDETGVTNKKEFKDWVKSQVKVVVQSRRYRIAQEAEDAKVETAREAAEAAKRAAYESVDADM